jgi:hypothetical protein
MEREDLITAAWPTRAARQGIIPCYRLGNLLRFKWGDVQDYLEKRREVGPASRVTRTGEKKAMITSRSWPRQVIKKRSLNIT